jgi:hypothetical protein
MGPYWGPGGGNYAKKYLSVAAGCYFILCGAGSGCCATQCCGNCGFPSFVLCGSNQSVATCAGGGQLGCVLCHRSYQACTGICIGSCSYGCTTWGADYSAQSNMGPNKESNYCWSNMWVWDAGSYKYKNSTRRGLEYCSTSLTNQGCNNMQGSKWPGGPGQSARACGGGCCWGGWGAGGLAMVTYG